jgi:hypothetical protein
MQKPVISASEVPMVFVPGNETNEKDNELE